jgi:hypothetical protein
MPSNQDLSPQDRVIFEEILRNTEVGKVERAWASILAPPPSQAGPAGHI